MLVEFFSQLMNLLQKTDCANIIKEQIDQTSYESNKFYILIYETRKITALLILF